MLTVCKILCFLRSCVPIARIITCIFIFRSLSEDTKCIENLYYRPIKPRCEVEPNGWIETTAQEVFGTVIPAWATQYKTLQCKTYV